MNFTAIAIGIGDVFLICWGILMGVRQPSAQVPADSPPPPITS
jgi:hypothetical protein